MHKGKKTIALLLAATMLQPTLVAFAEEDSQLLEPAVSEEQTVIESQVDVSEEAVETKKQGWVHTVEGWTYYENNLLVVGVKVIGGVTYEFDDNGIMVEGWKYHEGEGWYYYGIGGHRQYGWVRLNGTYYFLDPANNGIRVEGVQVIGGVTYEFDENGAMVEGWKYHEGEDWYYYGAGGHRQYGWVRLNGTYYFLDPANNGIRVEGVQVIGGVTYEFDENGAMAEGWKYREGEGWYYYSIGGHRQYGWQKLNGKYYYLDPKQNGIRLEGVQNIAGVIYEFDENGAMIEGWRYVEGQGYYYYGVGGHRQYGWQKIGGKWYYFNKSNEANPGIMVADCEKVIDGQTYLFTASGAVFTGWMQKPEGWYFYTERGQKATGWQRLGTIWYYFDPSTKLMCTDQWKQINGNWYSFETSGHMRQNWAKFDEKWYYFGIDGARKSGWHTIDGYRYYFYKENDANGGEPGVMATNVTIDGIKIDAYGHAAAYSVRIGSFSTVSTNNANGTYNMIKALTSFNQVVLQPGQTLSFFGVAGPCGKAEGYLPAGVVGGVGYGGGICQASTTLYGAALRAGLTVVERRNHSVPSTYVPIGQDAMVDYGSSDLKLRNDHPFPVKIVTYAVNKTLYAEIWGDRTDWYDSITVESWWTSGRSAAAQRTYLKNGKAVYRESLPSSYY